jgi:membrane-bound lytic murein transglycosylase D
MRKRIMQVCAGMMLAFSCAFSLSLAEKYPVYSYVFAEFDVDESYVYDSDFESFARKHEAQIKRFYTHSLQRGEELVPMVQGYLIDDGLSDLFIYLSMVESGFSPEVVSPKKAAGLWQFMPATAKSYKLDIHSSFDERFDPVSSTFAAINYLNTLYLQFGKWYLAAIAYNCGEGRLQKAIREAGSDELSILLSEREKYLPAETRDYIKKILLMAMIGESGNMDVGPAVPEAGNRLFQVEVAPGAKLKDIAALIEMDPSELMHMNRQFKTGRVPKEKASYKIMIPEEKMMRFYLRYEFPEVKKRIKPYLLSHYVKLGETMEIIAKNYHTTVEEIRVANRLQDDFLAVGTLLVIPVEKKIFDSALKK